VPEAVLGLGSNLGARRALLQCAHALLAGQPGLRILARSALYATPALGPPQPDYLNAALRIAWPGTLEGLFEVTQRVELLLGRERKVRWGARTLDIDLLHWSPGPCKSERLEVPHRELMQRNFALAPLLDVMPELAAQLAPRLLELGGAPQAAEPGWFDFERALSAPAERCCVGLDEIELACLVVGAVRACACPAAIARSTLPFRGLCAPAGPSVLDVLKARAAAAHQHGFRVVCAAITEWQAGAVAGLLAGEHTGAVEPCAWPDATLGCLTATETTPRASRARPL
jgi:2-amino-4-hydroxy-6-hydroxymethyldihydropteridine diphosphokinase